MSEQFAIDTPTKANWAIRKIIEIRRDAEHYKAFYAAEIARVAQVADEDCRRLEDMLRDYLAALPPEVVHTTKGGTRKMKLPDGELELKPAGIDYERDNAKLLAWAKRQGADYYRTKEEPAWSAIKAYLDETGDVPDGVTPHETPSRLTIKGG